MIELTLKETIKHYKFWQLTGIVNWKPDHSVFYGQIKNSGYGDSRLMEPNFYLISYDRITQLDNPFISIKDKDCDVYVKCWYSLKIGIKKLL